jgi:hypothetical protein
LSEKTQSSPNFVSMALALVVLALGYHVVSNYSSSPRPAPLKAGSASQQETHKVELRLWQDPFEPFESSTTNDSSSAKSTGKSDSTDTNSPPYSLSNDLEAHLQNKNIPTAILGVLLDGSSYADDKEVRLRLRYAVELALLTGEMGPEDRTHISTNSIMLDGKRSDCSYEWFKSRSDAANRLALVLWLKEDDFADNPARTLNSLIEQVSQLVDSNKNVSFFLIGPRSSDTLRALNSSLDTADTTKLLDAAGTGRFKILSAEATALIHDTTNDLASGHYSSWRASWNLSPDAITNLSDIVQSWTNHARFPSSFLWSNLSPSDKNQLLAYSASNTDTNRNIIWKALNTAIDQTNFSNGTNFPQAELPPEAINLAPLISGELDVRHFNDFVLERAYPNALAVNHASDPYGRKLQHEFDAKFKQPNVFHTWIANDQRLAELIAEEIKNRIAGPLEDAEKSNVVVILSEQDTYFGSRLADEWIDALVGNGVCRTNKDVWQFAYLRGLDGSKPVTEKAPKKPDLSASPEDALQSAEAEQQHNNLKADGNAQMDYIARLGDLLQAKDREMKNHSLGRIVAVGLTGSDSYDKLILLREISHRLPEAVFFTTDLDAPLWTANVLPYSRNLLVASAYPVGPNPKYNDWPSLEEFPPFRDVYQAAVFRACNAVVTNLWAGNPSTPNYDVPLRLLKGSLWELGRRGPVRLQPVSQAVVTPTGSRSGLITATVLGLLALGLIVAMLTASCNAGVRLPWQREIACATSEQEDDKISPQSKKLLDAARQAADERQLSVSAFLLRVAVPLLFGILAGVFLWRAWRTSQMPGEEPWNFFDGVSIWPSECIRFVALLGCFVFLWLVHDRLMYHRKRLWKLYFAEHGKSEEMDWNDFCETHKKRSGASRNPFASQNWLLAAWAPAFVKTIANDKDEASVDIGALFKCYLSFGDFWFRIARVVVSVILYVVIGTLLVWALHDLPTWLLVRGTHSHLFDRWIMGPSVFMVLVVLFYMLDAALLTKRVLNCISLHPTKWPERPLTERAADFSVKKEHLDGFFDVEFAAIQTQEVGLWMFGPFVFISLLLISRSSVLDNWTWPLGLKIVFIVNFVLGAACWFVVRRSAQKVRQFALERIELAKSSIKRSPDETIQVLPSENDAKVSPATENPTPPKKEVTLSVSKKKYLKNLESLRQAILDENRGAFARAFQDPSYLGVCIPSGLSGLISLIPLWFNR